MPRPRESDPFKPPRSGGSDGDMNAYAPLSPMAQESSDSTLPAFGEKNIDSIRPKGTQPMISQQRNSLRNILSKTQAIRTLRVVASVCTFLFGVACVNRTVAVTNETGDASGAAHDQKSEPSIYGKIAFSRDPGPAKRLRLFSFAAQPDGTRATVPIPYLGGQDGWKETSRFGSLECAVEGSWQETSYHHRSLDQ